MKNYYFKELLSFNRKDRNGILLLLCLLFIVILFKLFDDKILNRSDHFDLEIIVLNDSVASKRVYNKSKMISSNEVNDYQLTKLFSFDPNIVSRAQLSKLGFGKFQIRNLINYRNKGGYFKIKDDLLKIYGVDSVFYMRIKDSIHIAKSNNYNSDEIFSEIKGGNKNIIKKVLLDTLKIDLNSLNQYDLINMGGVKSKLANRIINYRNLIGGYFSYDQLFEVYEIDSAIVSKIKRKTTIDKSKLIKIDINIVSFKTLIKNPYFKKYQIDAIFAYRKMNKIDSISELINNQILDKKTYDKISHYIEIQ